MTTSALRRQVKNIVHNYSEAEIKTLRDFQYVDRDGRDQGANVREKARQLVCLLRDDDRLRQERSQALKTKERMAGGGNGGSSGGGGGVYGASASSPRAASDLEQARPQTSGEEELQLQLALAMSREESQKEQRCRQGDDSLLQKALDESRRESQSGTHEVSLKMPENEMAGSCVVKGTFA
ncbi:hypothetical protein GOODEAATRI_018731 [Goodea atripinnis]|uniref:ENTH domain-containing protein n=1 Tax=Goodea atripinnis TaxID=208336 RepID=A0ABV0P5Z4_9TELE